MKRKKDNKGRRVKKAKNGISRKERLKFKKKNSNRSQQQLNETSEGCQDIQCLSTLVQVLKMNKDTVQNFIKQKKRMSARLSVIANKKNKSSKTSGSTTSLANSLGKIYKF